MKLFLSFALCCPRINDLGQVLYGYMPLTRAFRPRADLPYRFEEGPVYLDARVNPFPMLRPAGRGTEALLQPLEFKFRSAMFTFDFLAEKHV
jgi:hypothetical protein